MCICAYVHMCICAYVHMFFCLNACLFVCVCAVCSCFLCVYFLSCFLQIMNSLGARETAHKVIFFLTDGVQNPTKDRTSGTVWDPLVNAEKLIKRGVKIYAIGVSDGVDKNQLYHIAGDPSRMLYAGSYEKLISKDFIENISKSTCNEVILATPPPTEPPITLSTQPSTQTRTQPTTQPRTQPPTPPPTQPSTQSPTQPSIQQPTGAPAKPPTRQLQGMFNNFDAGKLMLN